MYRERERKCAHEYACVCLVAWESRCDSFGFFPGEWFWVVRKKKKKKNWCWKQVVTVKITDKYEINN